MINDTVESIMSRDFARITPDMLVVESTNLLIQKALLGSPVLDENQKLVGWLSEQECLHVIFQVLYHNQRVSTVESVMRKDVLTISSDCTILDAITQMLTPGKPKAYPVVDGSGKVVGIISRRIIVRALDGLLGVQGQGH